MKQNKGIFFNRDPQDQSGRPEDPPLQADLSVPGQRLLLCLGRYPTGARVRGASLQVLARCHVIREGRRHRCT